MRESHAIYILHKTRGYRLRRKNVFINTAFLLLLPFLGATYLIFTPIFGFAKGAVAGVSESFASIAEADIRKALVPYWQKHNPELEAKIMEANKALAQAEQPSNTQ